MAACEASNSRTVTRSGGKAPGVRLFSRYSTPTSFACLTTGKYSTDFGRFCRTYSSFEYTSSTDASSSSSRRCVRITYCRAERGRSVGETPVWRTTTSITPAAVVASASILDSAPLVPARTSMSRPRWAPAFSTAMRTSCSISRGSTISLESACDALTTVSTSSCPEDGPIVDEEPDRRSPRKYGYRSSSCLTLPVAPQRT